MTSSRDKIWVVVGATESGDTWTLVFGYNPTIEEVEYEISANPWLNAEYKVGTLGLWTKIEEEVIR